ncbi:MAG TPA: right-handed parallel beta-helix repeat-containing protein [Dissulfurispiraceae bacterium]|nr:right-handed parallel beta-helix repeat-containing protein [Dissulfurispiraceae bacterium]
MKTYYPCNYSILCFLLCLLCFAFVPLQSPAATYEVGPGKSYANISDVPWENLQGGDTVLIYYRSTPYREKWVIAIKASQQSPLTVRGVAGPNGELPVIDGENAITRSQLNFWGEARGVLKIGGANVPNSESGSWIVIENLDIRSGRTPYQFSGRSGLTAYSDNAASVYIEYGQNIVVRNCIIHNSGNGLFVSAASRNITIEGCYIYDNGIEGSIYEHNTYTAAIGMTYQYNHFGPPRANCSGNNLKDRSAGLVVRYNWIDSGNRQLDLVDAEDSMDLVNDPSYHDTYVYGNILIEPDGAGNSQIVHYGGDSGNTAIYRKGRLHFYNNTIVSSRTGHTTLFRLSTNEETCDSRNNIIYVTASGDNLAMLDADGILHMRNNWTKPGWVSSHGGLTGQIYNEGGMINGSNPGFANEVGQDFHLASNSACINQGTALEPSVLPGNALSRQYVKHQSNESRPLDTVIDIGAFEAIQIVRPSPPTNLRIVD